MKPTGTPTLALIWAMARNRVIGHQNALPWRLPADLRRFKEITTGHPIIMGRKTFDSLGKPLPGRTNIVLSHDMTYSAAGSLVAHSTEEAVSLASRHATVVDPMYFVIGGENLYRQMLPRAERLYVTLVEADVEGDAHFPDFSWQDWQETGREEHAADEKNHFPYTFLTLQRKTPGR